MFSIVGGILCFLVFFLLSIIYAEEIIRKGKTKVKMGLVSNKKSYTGDNLPNKAIERMFKSIEKTNKDMEKNSLVI